MLKPCRNNRQEWQKPELSTGWLLFLFPYFYFRSDKYLEIKGNPDEKERIAGLRERIAGEKERIAGEKERIAGLRTCSKPAFFIAFASWPN